MFLHTILVGMPDRQNINFSDLINCCVDSFNFDFFSNLFQIFSNSSMNVAEQTRQLLTLKVYVLCTQVKTAHDRERQNRCRTSFYTNTFRKSASIIFLRAQRIQHSEILSPRQQLLLKNMLWHRPMNR